MDRILFTKSIHHTLNSCSVLKSYSNSDHFPVIAKVSLNIEKYLAPLKRKYLSWEKASEKALFAFSKLSEKLCSKSLSKFKNNEIDGTELYKQLVSNITIAAETCVPKIDPNKTPRTHNVPMWKERMASFKHEVDYWLQVRFLQGGANRCTDVVKQQLRISKSRYRLQFRTLRREIRV